MARKKEEITIPGWQEGDTLTPKGSSITEGCVGKTLPPEVHEEYLSGKHGHTVCYFTRRAAIQDWTKDTKETYFVISDVKQGIKYQIKLWS